MRKNFKLGILGTILSLVLNALVLIILTLVIINVTTASFNFGREYMQQESEEIQEYQEEY